MHKYAKIYCSAYVEARESILSTVKPVFLFLENVPLIWQGMKKKKKKSLPKGDSFGFLCWKSLCRWDRPPAGTNTLWFWEEKQHVQVARSNL